MYSCRIIVRKAYFPRELNFEPTLKDPIIHRKTKKRRYIIPAFLSSLNNDKFYKYRPSKKPKGFLPERLRIRCSKSHPTNAAIQPKQEANSKRDITAFLSKPI